MRVEAQVAPQNSEELQREKERFQEKWGHRLMMPDPYYNYGVLADNNIDGDEYFRWLSGGDDNSSAL